jgi:hypothetical protein
MNDFGVFIAPVHGGTIVVSHGEVIYIDESGGAELLYDDPDEVGELRTLKKVWIDVTAGTGVLSHHWKRIV